MDAVWAMIPHPVVPYHTAPSTHCWCCTIDWPRIRPHSDQLDYLDCPRHSRPRTRAGWRGDGLWGRDLGGNLTIVTDDALLTSAEWSREAESWNDLRPRWCDIVTAGGGRGLVGGAAERGSNNCQFCWRYSLELAWLRAPARSGTENDLSQTQNEVEHDVRSICQILSSVHVPWQFAGGALRWVWLVDQWRPVHQRSTTPVYSWVHWQWECVSVVVWREVLGRPAGHHYKGRWAVLIWAWVCTNHSPLRLFLTELWPLVLVRGRCEREELHLHGNKVVLIWQQLRFQWLCKKQHIIVSNHDNWAYSSTVVPCLERNQFLSLLPSCHVTLFAYHPSVCSLSWSVR